MLSILYVVQFARAGCLSTSGENRQSEGGGERAVQTWPHAHTSSALLGLAMSIFSCAERGLMQSVFSLASRSTVVHYHHPSFRATPS